LGVAGVDAVTVFVHQVQDRIVRFIHGILLARRKSLKDMVRGNVRCGYPSVNRSQAAAIRGVRLKKHFDIQVLMLCWHAWLLALDLLGRPRN
jgi:hypothetical protein